MKTVHALLDGLPKLTKLSLNLPPTLGSQTSAFLARAAKQFTKLGLGLPSTVRPVELNFFVHKAASRLQGLTLWGSGREPLVLPDYFLKTLRNLPHLRVLQLARVQAPNLAQLLTSPKLRHLVISADMATLAELQPNSTSRIKISLLDPKK